MAINYVVTPELIKSRQEVLTAEITNIGKRLELLDSERNQLVADVNALRGAVQQCDYFLGVINPPEEEIDSGTPDKDFAYDKPTTKAGERPTSEPEQVTKPKGTKAEAQSVAI